MKAGIRALDIAIVGVSGAILFISQVVLAVLPNIEFVSFFIILFTLFFGNKTIYSIYIFVLAEGIYYGFGIWWWNYLYVWTILFLLTKLFGKMEHPLGWAMLSGVYGLFFGLLCAIPYLFTMGLEGAVAYYIAGIPFDLLHCGGNFVVTLLLFKPLSYVFRRISRQLAANGNG